MPTDARRSRVSVVRVPGLVSQKKPAFAQLLYLLVTACMPAYDLSCVHRLCILILHQCVIRAFDSIRQAASACKKVPWFYRFECRSVTEMMKRPGGGAGSERGTTLGSLLCCSIC